MTIDNLFGKVGGDSPFARIAKKRRRFSRERHNQDGKASPISPTLPLKLPKFANFAKHLHAAIAAAVFFTAATATNKKPDSIEQGFL